jgi:acyl CoA:acetate/3-ketoacid CoA transferase alpha subunit
VKSAAAMAQQPAAGGGGLSGALARRMMGNKKPEQRSLLYTSTNETLSIDTTASEADVAIPAGFKEKK